MRRLLSKTVRSIVNRDVVINKNSRARPGHSTADPVVSPVPHFDTTEVRRCYDTRADVSAWWCSLTDAHTCLLKPNRGGDRDPAPS